MSATLTPASFRHLVGALGKEADRNMRDAGLVVERIVGLHPRLGPVLTVVSEQVAALMPAGPDLLGLPEPMREHEERLRAAFTVRGVEAAVWVGETWVFPDDDPTATARHLTEGLMPSEHPHRQEQVIVSGFWPRRGVAETLTYRIVRSPGGAYLRPVHDDAENRLLMVSSWLEDTLPPPPVGA